MHNGSAPPDTPENREPDRRAVPTAVAALLVGCAGADEAGLRVAVVDRYLALDAPSHPGRGRSWLVAFDGEGSILRLSACGP